MGELVADGPHGWRVHLMFLAHEIFDHPRMSPGEHRADALHLGIEAIVGFVADGNYCADAARRLTDEFGQIFDALVAGDIFRITDAAVFPRPDDGFIDVNASDTE